MLSLWRNFAKSGHTAANVQYFLYLNGHEYDLFRSRSLSLFLCFSVEASQILCQLFELSRRRRLKVERFSSWTKELLRLHCILSFLPKVESQRRHQIRLKYLTIIKYKLAQWRASICYNLLATSMRTFVKIEPKYARKFETFIQVMLCHDTLAKIK